MNDQTKIKNNIHKNKINQKLNQKKQSNMISIINEIQFSNLCVLFIKTTHFEKNFK